MKGTQPCYSAALRHQLDPFANQVRQGCTGAELFYKFRWYCHFGLHLPFSFEKGIEDSSAFYKKVGYYAADKPSPSGLL
jgi:hypothetical protein